MPLVPASLPTDFTIRVPDAALADLGRRLRGTRRPSPVSGEGWAAGMPDGALAALLDDWLGQDWRAVERGLNAWEQVLVPVHLDAPAGGRVPYRVHAVHRRGVGPDPLPIVLTHGWPSTFAEWRRVIGPLTDPAAHGGDPRDAFTVVAPSLPGYAFSPPPTAPGLSPRRISALWRELMAALGHRRFGAVGCDWGAYVSALLALDHPESVVGAHMGLVSLSAPPLPASQRSPADLAHSERVRRWRRHEHGYVAIQSTKPQTLAVALTDSPAGTAAWIAEKWWAWSDRDADGRPLVPQEDLLTALSLHWLTGSVGSAARIYYESVQDPVRLRAGQRVEVPCGFLLERPGDGRPGDGRPGDGRPGDGRPGDGGPFDVAAAPRIGAPPRSEVERAFRVTRWTQAPAGGHFPALETPELFVDEVRTFFRDLRDRSDERGPNGG